MDFTNRGSNQPAMPSRTGGGGSTSAPASSGRRGRAWKEKPMWLRVVWIALLFSATILAVSMLMLLYFGGANESKFIDKDKQQAVFLTNGQVYFGTIKTVNGQFMDLRNIYYLNVEQQVQPNQQGDQQQQQGNVRLVKLGCELHGPVDRMIINREQITFWENLKEEGQVSKAIAKWVQDNPDGQNCDTTATQSTDDAAKP